MANDSFTTLILSHVNREQEDPLSGLLFALGASGVVENLDYHQEDRKYQPVVVNKTITQLTAFFEQEPSADLIEKITSQFPNVRCEVKKAENKDWLEEWKAQWQPFPLVNDVWIVPEWHRESFVSNNRRALYIDPGMAFGTGTHETTQVAAELLTQLTSEKTISKMIDVGTGSGILALLAVQQGVKEILAYDNDPECHRVFLENCEKNQTTDMQWEEQWWTMTGRDLLVANIIDGVLLSLQPQFQKAKCQYYIFTGILAERESAFMEEMFNDWPLKTLRREQKGEWVGLLMESLL